MLVSDYLKNITSNVVKLSGGLNNDIYTDNNKIIRKYNQKKNFLDRDIEHYLVNILSYINIAPKIITKLKDGHIEELIRGDRFNLYKAQKDYLKIAHKLGHIHKINKSLLEIRKLNDKPILWDWLDYEYNKLGEKAKNYLNNLLGDHREIQIGIKRMRRVLDKIQIPITICHNDLTLGNILHTPNDDIRFIDWEFIGPNPSIFDVAALVYNLNLGEIQTNQFLNIYMESFGKINYENNILYKFLAPNRLIWALWGLNKIEEVEDHYLSCKVEEWLKSYLKLLDEYFPPNVYVVGVFDLLHLGHMNLLERAKKWSRGGKLIVGVHNDKDTESYKRLPYIDHKTRVNMIKHLKPVDEVVENGPFCRNTDKDFYEKYDIDYHIAGEDTHFYEPQKKLGVFKLIDSGNKVHTTDIIDKINRG